MAEKKMGEKEKSHDGVVTVVLKTETHCQGCATKILRSVKAIKGVEKAKAEWEVNKLTVRGEVDPWALREELQERIKKKVELISPLPSKREDKDGGRNGGKGEDKKNSGSKNNKDENKAKETQAPAINTAVLKLRLHCSGCIVKMHKIAFRTKGVESIAIDKEKELVTVKGTMDAKTLAESLEEKMKRSVAIVPPKAKGGGGGGKEEKKTCTGDAERKANKENDSREVLESCRVECVGLPIPPPICAPATFGPAGYEPVYGHPYPYPPPYMYINGLHPLQMFSDENPNNACSVM
ncbi:hypothetical protein SAY86_020376 [Trapa natans]|uniref:HMA domain-containing protein n=1 Tax=Trapa natans TaxID=22666 RepID=A0AAN7LMU2_TRANT|nr:hypothetical protein SAY86_020376 [Trapa natans]